MEANKEFRQSILNELAARGPLYAGEFESQAAVPWSYDSSWGGGKAITLMLDIMWSRGQVTVTRRQGNGFGTKKQWGLIEHQLGDRAGEPLIDRPLLVRRAAERACIRSSNSALPGTYV